MLRVQIESFSYSQKTILNNIIFSLKAGEHISILGESGCGKSTLLHIIYGLLHLEHGAITYNGKKLLGPTNSLIPGEPFMKLVAQEYNIMPFTTVKENLSSFLSGLEEEKDSNRINELLEVVEMEDFKNTLVKNLSGGQKQRVALAKALAKEPEILLLDEPFSNIDSFRKNNLQRKIFKYLKENNISCLTATHDSDEALAFSDEIIMLRKGSVEMEGKPHYIYNNVSTRYQASFFGEANLLPNTLFTTKSYPGRYSDKDDTVVIFPHELRISNTQENNFLQVTIETNYFKGSYYLIQSLRAGKKIYFINKESIEKGSTVYLMLAI